MSSRGLANEKEARFAIGEGLGGDERAESRRSQARRACCERMFWLDKALFAMRRVFIEGGVDDPNLSFENPRLGFLR